MLLQVISGCVKMEKLQKWSHPSAWHDRGAYSHQIKEEVQQIKNKIIYSLGNRRQRRKSAKNTH